MKVVTYAQIEECLTLLLPNAEIQPVEEIKPKWQGIYIKSEDVEYVLYANTINNEEPINTQSVFLLDIFKNTLNTPPAANKIFPHLGRALCYLSSK